MSKSTRFCPLCKVDILARLEADRIRSTDLPYYRGSVEVVGAIVRRLGATAYFDAWAAIARALGPARLAQVEAIVAEERDRGPGSTGRIARRVRATAPEIRPVRRRTIGGEDLKGASRATRTRRKGR